MPRRLPRHRRHQPRHRGRGTAAKRTAPVQRMLDALFEVATRTPSMWYARGWATRRRWRWGTTFRCTMSTSTLPPRCIPRWWRRKPRRRVQPSCAARARSRREGIWSKWRRWRGLRLGATPCRIREW